MNKKDGQKKRIYMDMAASTPIDEWVLEKVIEGFREFPGNPSSVHLQGVRSREALEQARREIASFLYAHPSDIFFTSGGTESNNLAILGLIQDNIKETHIITSIIEHPSVLEPIKELQRRGLRADFLGVDKNGRIDKGEFKEKLKKETLLVSLTYANNEIGTIEDIKGLAKVLRKFKKEQGRNSSEPPYFHIDASQGLLLDLNTASLGIDLMSVDAIKFGGPAGAGLLFKKDHVPLKPIFFGGGQEAGLRSGTQNLPSILGLTEALRLSKERRDQDRQHFLKIQKYFLKQLSNLPNVFVNGDLDNRIPNNLNITVSGVDSDVLVLGLDAFGVSCSAKSACQKDSQASYVLDAIGATLIENSGSLRFTWSREINEDDIDQVVSALKKVIETNS